MIFGDTLVIRDAYEDDNESYRAVDDTNPPPEAVLGERRKSLDEMTNQER